MRQLIYFILLLCLPYSAIGAVNLINNQPMEFGDVFPKNGLCYLLYDGVTEDVIQSGSPDICMDDMGKAGKMTLHAPSGQNITFIITEPKATDGNIVNNIEFRLEGIVTNDLGVKKSIRADRSITINSGNSGKVYIVLGGLLDIKSPIPFSSNFTLDYKIEYN